MKKEFISMVCVLLTTLACQSLSNAGTGIKTDRKTVVIDPGHGGTAQGSITPSGTREKDIMLRLSRMVAEILEKDYAVLLTRTDDISMDIEERTALANMTKADLFISLHAKPVGVRNTTASIFFFQPSQAQKKEPPLGTWNSAQLPHLPGSKAVADIICKALDPKLRFDDCTQGAPISILAGATMPALLIEPFSMGEFLDLNENSDDRLMHYARCLAKGIDTFFTQITPIN